jgi:hypothetical protein
MTKTIVSPVVPQGWLLYKRLPFKDAMLQVIVPIEQTVPDSDVYDFLIYDIAGIDKQLNGRISIPVRHAEEDRLRLIVDAITPVYTTAVANYLEANCGTTAH